jgi:sugar lactone lactonase YvrE
MKRRIMLAKGSLAGLVLLATPVLAQTYSVPPTSGPAANGSPGWHLAPSYPDPTGHTMVDASGKVTVVQRQRGVPDPIRATDDVPGCRGATICGRRGGFPRGSMLRVNWDTMPGWTPEYIYHLPPGLGGLPSVGLDSKGNLWAFQRRAPGQAQLMKFDTNHKLVLSVGDDVIGHQSKAHGLAVDADDNVWITDAGYSTVIKLSPQGKVLMTLGTRGKRGDWDEAKGQRLLWQPVMVAFGKNNDVYIAEGHANESPNDAGGPDPANNIGASRIIHLTRDGKFLGQWFGDEVGQGKFDSAHGLAVDPSNGDVWIGDREQYRIVVYSGDGKFLRTMQMRNLVCAIHFDNDGNPWMGSGQDGQFLKLTRDGKVVGAIGGGMGIGPGQFTEASYFVFDKAGDLYAGDTSVGRVTVMRKPR